MSAFEFESMTALLRRLKIGREEALQRSLTSLIVHGPYPRWNQPSSPSVEGISFLRALYEHCFDAPWPGGDPEFVDEFELPARTDDEKGGAPDWAVLWDDRLWIIELKSEVASHRATQIPQYFELGHHHHPDRQIDVTYLTPTMTSAFTISEPWARYSHVRWDEIVPMVRAAWNGPRTPGQAVLVDGICQAVEQLPLKPRDWRLALLQSDPDQTELTTFTDETEEGDDMVKNDPRRQAIELARETAVDGKQRALDVSFNSLEDLLEMRLSVKAAIGDEAAGTPVRFVKAWIWREQTSTGHALTDAGLRTGYELRLSRYRSE